MSDNSIVVCEKQDNDDDDDDDDIRLTKYSCLGTVLKTVKLEKVIQDIAGVSLADKQCIALAY